MSGKALILLPHATGVPDQGDFDMVICADSGIEAARTSGIKADLLIGDLDSISLDDLEKVEGEDVEIRRYPRDKDMTDGELALEAACEMGFDDILMIGGREGRMDHVVTSLLMPVLRSERRRIEVRIDGDRFLPLKEGDSINIGTDYRTVSIIPLYPTNRVSTSGLKWELEDEVIGFGSTRGIHNEVQDLPFGVQCSKGAVLLFLSNEN